MSVHEHYYSICPMLRARMGFHQIYHLCLRFLETKMNKCLVSCRFIHHPKRSNWIRKLLPRMAITTSSLSISIDPRAMKYSDVNTSPLCTNVSPGGACVVLNFNDNALD